MNDASQDQLIRQLAPTFQLSPSAASGAASVSGAASSGAASSADELLHGIMRAAPAAAAPVHRRSWFSGRRLLIAVPAVAAVAVLAFVIFAALPSSGPVGTPPAQAALTFTPVDGYLEITIKDPDADPQRYREELAEHGLNIELSLAPAGPDQVGKIIFAEYGDTGDGPKIESIEAPANCTANGNCEIGIRVPKNFTSYARIVFGRAAKPGESVGSPEGDAPVLTAEQEQQLRALVGKRVSEARKILAARGQTIEYRVGPQSLAATADQVPGTWYVTDTAPLSDKVIVLWASETTTPPSPLDPANPRPGASAQPSVKVP